MIERAYAKVNLCLDVVRKRDDGYHEMKMIMVPLNFYDVLSIEIADEMSYSQNVGYIPMDDRNTIIKAINVLRSEYGFEENFKIELQKHIPSQAGLAGGSADAAACIRLIRRLLHLDMNEEKMISLAKKVGADVPFCCLNKPCMVKGIGEILEPFTIDCDFYLFLVKPRKGVSTRLAFQHLDFTTCIHPDADSMQYALENNDYETFVSLLGNTLEQPSFEMVPEIEQIKKELVDFGFDGSLMSGSGSTVFAVTKDERLLKDARDKFSKRRYFVRSTSILK
ncbi:MAG: 4-(cytidine 5'-diphospho)-2-C-methyl-D-erythritol kinase [Erysipelotrichaceae bacterium]|nr:4-(cytidine 5'-diphospho)-2-C-methyl-D-erythritol kinase [Erysipelotrichaceae bacterium]